MIPPIIIAGIAGASALGLFKLRKKLQSQNSIYDWTESVGYHDEITPNACLDDGTPLLIKAIELNRADIVKILFEMNINPDVFSPERKPALFYALESKHAAKLLRLFIEHKANLNIMDSNGNTALFIARSDKLISTLCNTGCIVNAQNTKGQTALFVQSNMLAILVLMNHGANPNIQDNNGKTPLHYAMSSDENELKLLLLVQGASLNIRDNEGKTPLEYAQNPDEAFEYILNSCTDPNIILGNEGKTPLFYTSNSPEKTITLLRNGANPNIKDQHGKTPLFYTNSPEVAEYLLQYKADPNIQDNDGKTPLHYPICSTRPNLLFDNGKAQIFCEPTKLISKLLKYRANPNIRDNEGKTPLFYALDSTAQVKFLLNNGANPNIGDCNAKTPLCYVNSEDVLKALVNKGAYTPSVNIPPKFRTLYIKLMNQSLFKALPKDDIPSIVKAINCGADPSTEYNGLYALELASSPKTIKLLCDNGANPNKYRQIHSPLHSWILKNKPNYCRILIKHGANIKSDDLNCAISNNYVQCSEVLLKTGYEVTIDNWQTAFTNGSAQIIELLEKYSDFKLPLAEAPTLELKIRIAKRNQQNIDIQANFDQIYPPSLGLDTNLLMAVDNNDTDAVRMLLEKGANPNSKSSSDTPMLEVAFDHNHPEIVDLLCKAGANPNSVSPQKLRKRNHPVCLKIIKSHLLSITQNNMYLHLN